MFLAVFIHVYRLCSSGVARASVGRLRTRMEALPFARRAQSIKGNAPVRSLFFMCIVVTPVHESRSRLVCPYVQAREQETLRLHHICCPSTHARCQDEAHEALTACPSRVHTCLSIAVCVMHDRSESTRAHASLVCTL